MANRFLPGGLVSNIVNRATFDRESAMRTPTTAEIIQNRISRMAGTAPKVPTVAEGAARESRLANTLRAYGLGTPSTAAGAALKPSAMDTVSSLLPAAGTPVMAGLGAAGRTMMQLGGWQDKPYTLGQIVGAGAEKGIAAMQEQQRAEAASKRQAQQDELTKRYREAQIEQMKTPKEKAKKAISWKQRDYIDPETQKRGKADVAFLPIGDPLIEALGGDLSTGMVVRKGSFIEEATSKKENMRTVPGVGVVDFSNPDKPKVLMESKDPRRYKNLGTYRLKGKVIGEGTLDSHTGKRFIMQPDGTKKPIPEDAIPVTEGMAAMGIPNFSQFKKIRDELNADEVSMRNYASYLKNIEKANSGVGRLADDLTAYIKTFLSTNAKEFGLTEQELALRIAQGQMQGLLGSARIETVGGGVMTEQDALRVIENLGGNVNALQSKAVVKAQITRMFAQKYKGYEKNILEYNNAVNSLYSDRNYKRKKPIEVDARLFDPKILSEMGVTNLPAPTPSGDGAPEDIDISVAPEGFPPEDWAVLSDEDKRSYLAAGK